MQPTQVLHGTDMQRQLRTYENESGLPSFACHAGLGWKQGIRVGYLRVVVMQG